MAPCTPNNFKKAALENNAYAGFAFDGDGDRIIAVNNEGEIKDGDDILALLCQHPLYENITEVVGTLMSNKAFEDYLINHGKQLMRTNVGDKYIAQALETRGLTLGGEPSGHIIMKDYLSSCDAIFTALRVLESMQINQNETMHTFEKYPQILLNIAIINKKDLKTEPCASIIQSYEKQLNNGRILVRYSGTEPVLRIMVEDSNLDHAQSIAQQLADHLAPHLQ